MIEIAMHQFYSLELSASKLLADNKYNRIRVSSRQACHSFFAEVIN